MNLHGVVRATTDIDILIPRDEKNADTILRALENLPMGIAREHSAKDLMRCPILILGDDPRVDVVFGMGKLSYEEARKNGENRTVEGVAVTYLSMADLIRAKDTDRPKDKIDVETLRALRPEAKPKGLPQRPKRPDARTTNPHKKRDHKEWTR